MQTNRSLEHSLTRFFRLLYLLLDSILLRFKGEDSLEACGDGVEVAGSFFRGEGEKLGDHKVTEDFDVVFVREAFSYAVVEV